jgi:heptosyltransferase-2
MAEEYLELAGMLGGRDDGAGLELRASDAARDEVERAVGPGRPRVGIAPGAAFGPSKRWLPDRFAAVADALANRHGARCLLLTGPGEEDTAAEVRRHATTDLPDPYAGRPTVEKLKAAVAGLDVLVCNDSGPRHVAVAFGVPTVCVMGSTRPVYSTGPYERGHLLRIDVDCGPCQKPVCTTDHRCMTGVSAEAVAAAAEAILRGGVAPPVHAESRAG